MDPVEEMTNPHPDVSLLVNDEVSASSYVEDGQADNGNGLDILASAIHGYPEGSMEDEDVLAQGAAWTALYPLTADGTGEQIFAVDFCGDYHTPVVIGRGPMAHVDLGVEERRISKKHVVIEYVEELQLFQLQCLGVNSCRVNGHVETRRCPPTVLEGGDIIEIDGKLLRFHLPPDPVPSPQFQPKRASAETYDDISAKRRRLISQQLAEAAAAAAAAAAPKPEPEILNPEDLVRPNLSWASLISAAFLSSGKQYLLVAQIYDQIMVAHPFFRFQKNNNWKNAVRHALSVHNCFYRVNENEYKGGFWGYRAADKPRDKKAGADQSSVKQEPLANVKNQPTAAPIAEEGPHAADSDQFIVKTESVADA